MIYHELGRTLSQYSEKIYCHSFNIGLLHGTLSKKHFGRFLQQDKLYLQDFARALRETGNRFAHQPEQLLFHGLSKYILNTEIKLYDKYFPELMPSPSLFSPPRVVKIPSVDAYTKYLLCTEAPANVAVAKLAPCFLLYKDLGVYMKPRLSKNNQYEQWVNSYTSEKFMQASQQITQVLITLSEKACPQTKEDMLLAFESSLKFEIAFWDEICSPVYGETPQTMVCGI